MKHRATNLRPGWLYHRAQWSYRGFTLVGIKPRHNWGGSGWRWETEDARFTSRTRRELMARIDAHLDARELPARNELERESGRRAGE